MAQPQQPVTAPPIPAPRSSVGVALQALSSRCSQAKLSEASSPGLGLQGGGRGPPLTLYRLALTCCTWKRFVQLHWATCLLTCNTEGRRPGGGRAASLCSSLTPGETGRPPRARRGSVRSQAWQPSGHRTSAAGCPLPTLLPQLPACLSAPEDGQHRQCSRGPHPTQETRPPAQGESPELWGWPARRWDSRSPGGGGGGGAGGWRHSAQERPAEPLLTGFPRWGIWW